jgi:DNA helicase-2/ATP-dependent DNA helicase PcrA
MTSPLLQSLNDAQQRALQVVDGPVLVLAGPGSGKTRLLTHRVAYLIDEVGVDPFHILAVTFTNKAAREMRERLEHLIPGGQAAGLTVGTFHSLCSRFLRRDIIHLGRERDFAIYDTDDQERVMKRVLRELKLDEKKTPPRAILGTISGAKNELVDVPEYARLNRTYYDEIVARCYERYQALLRESNALDFDDLLFATVRLFEYHPDVLAHYHERYRYLLVDEYQDTNHAQYMLVKQLAARHRNLFVVGDEDQSIYAWRGANVRNILQFEDDYPDARVFLLEQNYRSTQAILDTAQAVIDGGTQRKHRKKLWTQNDAGIQVTLIEGYDQNDEAQRVAEEIARLHASEGYRLSDFAVMYRTNAQSGAIEEAMGRHGLPYQLIGGMRFYERKEVKDILAYLRVITNPADSVSLERIINTPTRGIGQKTITDLQRWAADMGMSLYHALRELANDDPHSAPAPFSARPRKALLGFLALLDGLLAQRPQLDLHGVLGALLETLNFREALLNEYGPEEGEERWENVRELFARSEDVTALPREEQLPTFLEQVALVADLDKLDPNAEAVTCITLHQAKGLEYPVVFLIGLEEGRLPHNRSLDEQDKLDEERRLLYVGATRARERLYLLYAFRRTIYGRTEVSTPSRFLKAIPRELLKQASKRASTSMPASGGLSRLIDPGQQTSARSKSMAQQRQMPTTSTASFFPGQRVRHNAFGEGVVVSSKLIEGDEEVIVNFATRGEKKLLASFARLQRVD